MSCNLSLKRKRNIVKELIEKQERWVFTDTECRVDKEVECFVSIVSIQRISSSIAR
jgi:hypothetical protein